MPVYFTGTNLHEDSDAMSEPVKIMLDGMSEEPIAIPFPFKVGSHEIRDPDDWHDFLAEVTRLQDCANELACLQYAGVDNWVGYSYGYEIMQESFPETYKRMFGDDEF